MNKVCSKLVKSISQKRKVVQSFQKHARERAYLKDVLTLSGILGGRHIGRLDHTDNRGHQILGRDYERSRTIQANTFCQAEIYFFQRKISFIKRTFFYFSPKNLYFSSL